MLRRHQRKFALATLGITVLMVSACSDGGERTSTTATTTATTEAPTTTVKPLKKLDVAVVTPSAENDLAFTQSMVDALKLVATERGADGMSLQVTPQMFDVEKARAEVERYASEGVDVIFAHGSQYGDIVKETATAYPEITFAWGTASDTFGLPNVYAYTVAADQGGYVLGVLAAELTGGYALILPLIVTCVTSNAVSQALGGRPVYELLLERTLRLAGQAVPPSRVGVSAPVGADDGNGR
jgi:basic membrane lipoprotein Med (substrate-binding protein (PBP1-ABC) superfamily)